jgi:hypothetical protein
MIFTSKQLLAHMNTAYNAINLRAPRLLLGAIVALLAMGSLSAQAHERSQAGDVLIQDLTPISRGSYAIHA